MTAPVVARADLREKIRRAEASAILQHRSVSTLLLMGEVDAATRMAHQAEATERRIEALRVELGVFVKPCTACGIWAGHENWCPAAHPEPVA